MDPGSTRTEEGRRSALVRLVGGGLGLIGAGLAGLVGVVATPPRRQSSREWRRLISVFEVGSSPTEVLVGLRRADGWYETRSEAMVYVDRDGDAYRVLSATCTHLGCRVRWEEADGRFRCRCHGGTYDREGRVVAGPPPRPLERLNIRLNEETSDLEVEL